jgi:hypothetical protein
MQAVIALSHMSDTQTHKDALKIWIMELRREKRMYQSILYLETLTGMSFPIYFSCRLKYPTSLGQSLSFSPHAYTRYTSHFGAPNFEVSLANHTLITFDAPNYVDKDAKRHGQKKSVEEWVLISGGSA